MFTKFDNIDIGSTTVTICNSVNIIHFFQLKPGNMVSYTLSELNIPLASREYLIQTTYMRPYYLSGAEIIFLSYCKSYIKRHFNMASRVLLLAFLFLVEFENFLHHKKDHTKEVYSRWINRKNTPIEQILNSKDVEAREIFPTFEKCTGKSCYGVKNNGFSWCHSEVSLTSRAPYIRLQPQIWNHRPVQRTNEIPAPLICSMTKHHIHRVKSQYM